MASPRNVTDGDPRLPAPPVPREPHQPVLAALVVFHAFYYSFRYPLQYNDALTSAAYRDTPMVLRAADDVVFLLLVSVVVLMKMGRGRLLLNRRHLVASGAILVCFSGILLGLGLEGAVKVKGVAIYSLLLAVTSAADLRYMISFIFRYLVRFYLLLLLVDAVQVLLFLAIGRPPALAWSTEPHTILTQDVRFGSLWDDPNSFGLFLVFVVTWVLYAKLPARRKVLLVVPVPVAAAASWSRTCLVLIGVSVAGFLLAEAWRALQRRRFLGGTVRAVLAGSAVVAAILLLPTAVQWANESVTSRVHLKAVLMRGMDAVPYRMASGRMVHSESVFTFVARNGGWFAALALLLVLSVPLLHLFRFLRLSAHDRMLVAWAGLSIVSFFSIPFLWLAPMGLLFFLVYGYLLEPLGRMSTES